MIYNGLLCVTFGIFGPVMTHRPLGVEFQNNDIPGHRHAGAASKLLQTNHVPGLRQAGERIKRIPEILHSQR